MQEPLSDQQVADLKAVYAERFPGTCTASAGVFDHGGWISYAIKGESDVGNSSGWRFIADLDRGKAAVPETKLCPIWEVLLADSRTINLLLMDATENFVVGSSFYVNDDNGWAEEE